MPFLRTIVRCVLLLLPCIVRAAEPGWLVTRTAATDNGSLADAIIRMNASAKGGTITFAVPRDDAGYDPATRTWRIRLKDPLPPITRENVCIDASSVAGRIVIEADKASIEYALTIASSNCTIRGLSISGFKHGLVLYGAAARRNQIEQNNIGPANDTALVLTDGAADNTISDNVISGNRSIGVYIGGRQTAANILKNNRIGCDTTGTLRVPNSIGIMIARSSKNLLAGNTISGNDDIGILLVGKWTESNRIEGNCIGSDITGRKLLHNDKGIVIKSLANNNRIGGPAPAQRNVISGNIEIGLYIEAADNNVIQGNLIGPDITGRKALADDDKVQGNGVEFNTCAKGNILGGTADGERNLISGNKVYGVVYYGHCQQNSTLGNFIGTDITGEAPLPNATGICVDCASHHNDIAFNAISGNLSYGMFFVTRGTEGNTLRGNRIGTNAAGTKALPNDIGMVISTGAANNLVGGPLPEDRNLISGNRQSGLMITNRFTEGNRIEGNSIGLDITGTKSLPNRHGVVFSTYPARNILRQNVISGNEQAGIVLCEYAKDNEILANIIGPDASRAKILGNGGPSIAVDDRSKNNVLDRPGQENTLAPSGIVYLNRPASIAPRPALPAANRDMPPAAPAGTLDLPDILRAQPDVRTTLIVTSTRDSGPGSLREAVERCNKAAGHARITFDIPNSDTGFEPASGLWRIRLADALPSITTSDVLVDGRRIALDGNDHSVECGFLLLNASRIAVRGFVICGFVYGVQIYGANATGNWIAANELSDNYNAVEILSGAHDNVIGGSGEADRNIVIGNHHIGIRISDANGNRVSGNYVGIDRTGGKAVPNYDGICAEGRSRGNLIGGRQPGERNIASGNVAYGIDLFGAGVQENIIVGNYIGTDAAGTRAIPNTYGVLFDDRAARNILGGTDDGEGNLISGNTAFGAYIYNNGTSSNQIRGNRIGTDATGKVAIPNETGVHVDGGAVDNLVERNLISGNVVAGVTIFALYTDRNIIDANRIGVDIDGRPLGNGADGIRIAFGPRNNTIGGKDHPNLIANHGGCGIAADAEDRSHNRILQNTFANNRGPEIGVSSDSPKQP
ncbi:MAG: NosD domain-containing protein [Tepidisphaeraceae bacterium]